MKLAYCLLTAVLFATFVLAENFVPGEILVFFKDGVTQEQAETMVQQYGLHWTPFFHEENSTEVNFALIKVPVGQEELWISKIAAEPYVKRVQRNPEQFEAKVEIQTPEPISLGNQSVQFVEKVVEPKDYKDYFILAVFGTIFIIIIVSIMLKVERKHEIEVVEKRKK